MIFPSLQLTSRILGQVWRRFVRPLGTVKAGLPDKRQTLWGHCCARHFPGRLLRSRETVLARPAPLLGTPVCASEVRARSAPCPVHRPYYDPRPGPRQSARGAVQPIFRPAHGHPTRRGHGLERDDLPRPAPVHREGERPPAAALHDLLRPERPPKAQPGLDVDEQRAVKRDYLRDQGIASFYYISHAPFLFMAQNTTTLQEVRDRMIALGIPEQTLDTIRLQPIQ